MVTDVAHPPPSDKLPPHLRHVRQRNRKKVTCFAVPSPERIRETSPACYCGSNEEENPPCWATLLPEPDKEDLAGDWLAKADWDDSWSDYSSPPASVASEECDDWTTDDEDAVWTPNSSECGEDDRPASPDKPSVENGAGGITIGDDANAPWNNKCWELLSVRAYIASAEGDDCGREVDVRTLNSSEDAEGDRPSAENGAGTTIGGDANAAEDDGWELGSAAVSIAPPESDDDVWTLNSSEDAEDDGPALPDKPSAENGAAGITIGDDANLEVVPAAGEHRSDGDKRRSFAIQ